MHVARTVRPETAIVRRSSRREGDLRRHGRVRAGACAILHRREEPGDLCRRRSTVHGAPLLATRMPSSLTWAVLAFGMVPMVSSFCDQGGRRPVPNLRTQAGHRGRSRHAGQDDFAGERVFAEGVDVWRGTPCRPAGCGLLGGSPPGTGAWFRAPDLDSATALLMPTRALIRCSCSALTA